MGLRWVFLLLVATAPAEAASLYERLGGKAGVGALVEELVSRAAADPRLKGRFLDVDLPHLKSAFGDFLCVKSGGACAYQGRELRAAHAGMQIVDAEWQALLEDLDGALHKLNVAPAESTELTNLVKPLGAEVVQAPSPEALKVDVDLVDKAKQLSSMLNNVGKLKPGELLQLAVAARVRGQRSYAEYLYSLAETYMKPGSLAIVAPLFRQGGPPRIVDPTRPAQDSPQPQAAGSSDDDDSKKRSASLTASLTVDGKPALAMLALSGGGARRRPPHARVVEIRGGKLAPLLTVVPVGSTVSFANFDPIFHNWFSLSPSKPFDLGLYKGGEQRQVTFDKEGVVRVSCNLHSHTAAYVIVVSAPYYGVSDGEGQLLLKNLAPGRYQARLWSDGAESVKSIAIRAGENHLSLDAKRGPAPAITDKLGQ